MPDQLPMQRKQNSEHDQLMVLYTLSEADTVLSEDQLARILSDLGIMQYFDLKAALYLLTAADHVEEIPVLGGSVYRLTPSGRNLAEQLRQDMRHSMREAVDAYMRTNRRRLEIESSFVAAYTRIGENKYRATARILSDGAPVFELSLIVPSKEEAQTFVAQWPRKGSEFYQRVLLELTV